MKDRPITIWINTLSLLSLGKIITAADQHRRSELYYIEKSRGAALLLTCIGRLRGFSIELHQCAYDLADLKIDNECVGMKFQREVPMFSSGIVKRLRKSAVYEELSRIFPKESVDLYFEKKIWEQIQPSAYLYFVSLWTAHQNPRSRNVIVFQNSFLAEELRDVFSNPSIELEFYNKLGVYLLLLQKLIRVGLKYFFFMRRFIVSRGLVSDLGPFIAVHCNEGVRKDARSDLFWWNKSGVPAERIVFFFNSDSPSYKSIEGAYDIARREGMRWIACQEGEIRRMGFFLRHETKAITLSGNRQTLVRLKSKPKSGLDWWVYLIAIELSIEVERWRVFYKYFNIKIMLKIGGQFADTIAQNIALAAAGGVRVGIQRSTVCLLEWMPFLRYNANDILFVWGREAQTHKGTSGIIRHLIITGYPFDDAFIDRKERGDGKFAVALFDNSYGSCAFFSEKIISTFYRKFLEWALEDDDVIIIAKEKKTHALRQLGGIVDLVAQVEGLHRIIRINDPFGSFPSKASAQADMSVGIGISSALMEAVIVGHKGVHCDMSGHHFHTYYSWGYEKIIFDDIDRLIKALKEYKKDRRARSELGDWSDYIDTLEPFRDGKGGERIGVYLKNLLDGFDADKDRDEIVKNANILYVRQWGEDRVVDLRDASC